MKEKVYIDINLQKVESKGVAYYRLPDDVLEFFNKCLEKHAIVGFEWEEGSRNFGVILVDRIKELSNQEEGKK